MNIKTIKSNVNSYKTLAKHKPEVVWFGALD